MLIESYPPLPREPVMMVAGDLVTELQQSQSIQVSPTVRYSFICEDSFLERSFVALHVN